jgi:hypothetical protein
VHLSFPLCGAAAIIHGQPKIETTHYAYDPNQCDFKDDQKQSDAIYMWVGCVAYILYLWTPRRDNCILLILITIKTMTILKEELTVFSIYFFVFNATNYYCFNLISTRLPRMMHRLNKNLNQTYQTYKPTTLLNYNPYW